MLCKSILMSDKTARAVSRPTREGCSAAVISALIVLFLFCGYIGIIGSTRGDNMVGFSRLFSFHEEPLHECSSPGSSDPVGDEWPMYLGNLKSLSNK